MSRSLTAPPTSVFGSYAMPGLDTARYTSADPLLNRLGGSYLIPPVADGRLQYGENSANLDPYSAGFVGRMQAYFEHKPSDTIPHNLIVPMIDQCGFPCNISRGMPIWTVAKKYMPDPYLANYYKHMYEAAMQQTGTGIENIRTKYKELFEKFDKKFKEEKKAYNDVNTDQIELALRRCGWKFCNIALMVFTAPMVIKAFRDLAAVEANENSAANTRRGGTGSGAESAPAIAVPPLASPPVPSPGRMGQGLVAGPDHATRMRVPTSGFIAAEETSPVGGERETISEKTSVIGGLVAQFHSRLVFSGFALQSDPAMLSVAHGGDMQIHNYFVKSVVINQCNAYAQRLYVPRPGDYVGFWLKEIEISINKNTFTPGAVPTMQIKTYTLLPVIRRRGESEYLCPWDEMTRPATYQAKAAGAKTNPRKRTRDDVGPTEPQPIPSGCKVFEVGVVLMIKDVLGAMRTNTLAMNPNPDPPTLLPALNDPDFNTNNAVSYEQAHVHAATTVPNVYISIMPLTLTYEKQDEIKSAKDAILEQYTADKPAAEIIGDIKDQEVTPDLVNKLNTIAHGSTKTLTYHHARSALEYVAKLRQIDEKLKPSEKKETVAMLGDERSRLFTLILHETVLAGLKNP